MPAISGRAFWVFTIAVILLTACSPKDECDCKNEPLSSDDTVADDTNAPPPDDDSLASDDTAATCEEGEKKCRAEGEMPQECRDGIFVDLAACPDYSYCNFGECVTAVLDLPRDESPHEDIVEWWYWTGNVHDAEGNVYGFEHTYFYGAAMFGFNMWMINEAVIDLSESAHEESSWLDQGPADATPDELHLASRDSYVNRGADNVYALGAATQNYAFELTLVDEQSPTFHGDTGSIRMSSRTSDSFYYSRMRMSVTGTITRGSESIPVEGEAWMDHQWGGFNPFVIVGWDWFSMQFQDGTEIMYFIFRSDEHDPTAVDMALGTFVDENGDQTTLFEQDVSVTPLDTWTSPTTGGVYPQNWNFLADTIGLDVTVASAMPDQEMPNIMWNYWEGLVDISGTRDGVSTQGRGFVELSGYSGRPLLWFLFDEWNGK
jgi:predicted secreted hydrolase